MFKLYRVDGSDAFEIFYILLDHKGLPINYVVIRKGSLKTIPYKEDMTGVAFLKLSGRDLKLMMPEFMDMMLEHGVKPKSHTMTEPETKAVERHLQDMRDIVFFKLLKTKRE